MRFSRKQDSLQNVWASRTLLNQSLFFSRFMGGRTPPCLLTVARSSDLILMISKQFPWLWRVVPSGSSAVCMVTVILEVRVGQHDCAWPDIFRLIGAVLLSDFPVLFRDGRGGRVNRCGSLKWCWLPVSKNCCFLVDEASCGASLRVSLTGFLQAILSASLFSTGVLLNDVILSSFWREISECSLRCGRWNCPSWNASLTCSQYISARLWTSSWVRSQSDKWRPTKNS